MIAQYYSAREIQYTPVSVPSRAERYMSICFPAQLLNFHQSQILLERRFDIDLKAVKCQASLKARYLPLLVHCDIA